MGSESLLPFCRIRGSTSQTGKEKMMCDEEFSGSAPGAKFFGCAPEAEYGHILSIGIIIWEIFIQNYSKKCPKWPLKKDDQ